MKFTIAYYLMLLYITVIFKPLIPFISDAASHFFDDAIHIATVHAIYGDNHIEKELAASGSAEDNNKNQGTLKVQEPVPVHISEAAYKYDHTLNIVDKHYYSLQVYDPELVYLSTIAPPPKAV
ncbi:MAG TPA: hypothetical protein PLA68_13375 [Panacibacter sp.]|nr:hypothetical protein [Panacibacter sp.]